MCVSGGGISHSIHDPRPLPKASMLWKTNVFGEKEGGLPLSSLGHSLPSAERVHLSRTPEEGMLWPKGEALEV